MTYLTDWSTRDRGLAEGLLMYEAGLNPHGIPARISTDPDNDGWFEVEERTDYAQAAVDRWNEASKGKHDPGVFPVVIDVRPDRG